MQILLESPGAIKGKKRRDYIIGDNGSGFENDGRSRRFTVKCADGRGSPVAWLHPLDCTSTEGTFCSPRRRFWSATGFRSTTH